MKITPLLMFLLLLVVLVLSVVICKHCFGGKSSEQEGFVSFDTNTASLDEVSIPQYSMKTTVSKLYDNIFFDSANGNLIEVNAPNFTTSSSRPSSSSSGNVITSNTIDTTGKSILNINITARVGNPTKSYTTQLSGNTVVGQNTTESTIKDVSSSYANWTYTTKSINTSSYQVFYMPWDTKTYMHMVRLNSAFDSGDSQNMYTFKYENGSSPDITRYTNEPIKLTSKEPDKDSNNNTYIIDQYYDSSKKVYQLSKYVKFDASNGDLIIRSNNSITIYNRYKSFVTYNTPGQIKNTSTTIKSVYYSPWVVSDNYQNQVLYVPDGKNTLIALFQMDPANKGQYKIDNLVRFTEKGLDDETASKDASGNSAKRDASGNSAKRDASGNNIPAPPSGADANTISDYYKWYWYWNSNGGNGNSASKYSDDYILKTQIVPPVCPSCPSCSEGSSCTNCGGQGGCGTLNNDGSTVVSGNASLTNMPNISAANYQISAQSIQTPPDDSLKIQAGTQNVQSGGPGTQSAPAGPGTQSAPAGPGTQSAPSGPGIINNTVDTAGKIVGGTVGAVAGVANNAINTVGSILTQGSNSGSNSLYASSGNSGSLQSAGAAAIPGQGQAVSGSTPIDNYSRYGALVSKGSNFIPVTSDFSQFGK